MKSIFKSAIFVAHHTGNIWLIDSVRPIIDGQPKDTFTGLYWVKSSWFPDELREAYWKAYNSFEEGMTYRLKNGRFVKTGIKYAN